MQQEATDELVGRERHGPVPGLVPVVLPAELHGVPVEGEQPVVGDGDAN